MKACELRKESVVKELRGGNMDGCGEDVVAGLAEVDVVVGVDGVFGAECGAGELGASVGDDLVRIHVARGAGAGLENAHREMSGPTAVGHLPCGREDEERALRR